MAWATVALRRSNADSAQTPSPRPKPYTLNPKLQALDLNPTHKIPNPTDQTLPNSSLDMFALQQTKPSNPKHVCITSKFDLHFFLPRSCE